MKKSAYLERAIAALKSKMVHEKDYLDTESWEDLEDSLFGAKEQLNEIKHDAAADRDMLSCEIDHDLIRKLK
jgi:hypothetical protein